MSENREWDSFVRDVLPILKRTALPDGDPDKWYWFLNPQCKYIDVRIDMRDLGCIIMNRGEKRITVDELAYQYRRSDNE